MKNHSFTVAIFLAGALISGATVVLYGDYVSRSELEAYAIRAEERSNQERDERFKLADKVDKRHEEERDIRTEILANQSDMKAVLKDLVEEVRRLRDKEER
jgi:hypothetical protein